MSGKWTHVFGGFVEGAAEDADGNPTAAWYTTKYIGSSRPPEDLTDDEKAERATEVMRLPATIRYLASFDHEPTDAEMDALAPEGYES